MSREIIINKPINILFNYLKFIKNQDNFSKWNTIDKDMVKKFTGIDGIVGFIYKWESNNKKSWTWRAGN
jgi:hypothetical protein